MVKYNDNIIDNMLEESKKNRKYVEHKNAVEHLDSAKYTGLSIGVEMAQEKLFRMHDHDTRQKYMSLMAESNIAKSRGDINLSKSNEAQADMLLRKTPKI